MLVFTLLSLATAAPVQMTHQGRLLDPLGEPVDQADTPVTVSLWTAPTNGTEEWSETHPSVDIDAGYYAVVLGSVSTLDSSVLAASSLWLQIQLGTGDPLTRLPLHSVPTAAHAIAATSVSGGLVDASEIRVNGTPVVDASGNLLTGVTLDTLPCSAGQLPQYGGAAWTCTDANAHTHALSAMTGTLSASQMPTTSVSLAAGSTMDGQPISTGSHLTTASAVAAVSASDTYVQNSGDTMSGDLTVGGRMFDNATWGTTALSQGVLAMPEGGVYQEDNAVVFTGHVIVMNPAAGSYIRVQAGTYALDPWGYLYVDLPPANSRGSVLTPQIAVWNDSDQNYPNASRFVLAQRRASGRIFLNMAVPAASMNAPQTYVTRTSGSLGDQRNSASKSTAGTWWAIPNRTLTFTKHFSTSTLKVTYQDTLGTEGRLYDGCEWQIRIDGTPIHTFSTADHDRASGEANDWTMTSATQTAWYSSAGAGSHTISIYNRGDRGAWGSGTDECLMGWNTTTNFISVEEIP